MTPSLKYFVLAAVLLLAPLPAIAHDFWLQPHAFAVAPGGSTSMMILVGHGENRQKSLITADRVTRFTATTATGQIDRRAELRMGDANADSVLRFAKPGLQVLSFSTNGTYSELPGLRFTDYLKAEGLVLAINLRRQSRQTDAPGREVYSRCAKSLVQVGSYAKGDDAVATRATGLALEIVPDLNPYAPGFRGILPVHVYYQGKPLAGATVKLNNLDFDARPVETLLTDAQGRATVHFPHLGLWQMNVIWTQPIKDPKADFMTTFSSLTFGYSAGK